MSDWTGPQPDRSQRCMTRNATDPMQVIEIDGLALVPQTAAHAGEMFVVLSDPAIYEHENEPPASVEALRNRFAMLESRQSADGQEHGYLGDPLDFRAHRLFQASLDATGAHRRLCAVGAYWAFSCHPGGAAMLDAARSTMCPFRHIARNTDDHFASSRAGFAAAAVGTAASISWSRRVAVLRHIDSV